MYQACGAVSKADHELLSSEKETLNEEADKVTEELQGEKLGELQEQVTKAEEATSELEKKTKSLQADIKTLLGSARQVRTDCYECPVARKKAEIEEAKESEKKHKEQLAEEEKSLKKLKKELEAAEERTVKAKKDEEEARDAASALENLADEVANAAEACVDELAANVEGLMDAPGQEHMAKKEGDTITPNGSAWSTQLCCCCAKPGGCCLCLKTFICPCWILGNINQFTLEKEKPGCPGGCCGGCCLGCLCTPCYMCRAAPTVADSAGFQESKWKACICTCCCPQCYVGQVHRETLIIKNSESGGTSTAPERWTSGLFHCCAQPGGCGVCCKSFFCPCWLCGGINRFLKENEAAACPGGCPGGCCLGCCCHPCFFCRAAPAVADKNGKTEGKWRAFCTACFCPCCYTMQVYRETLLCSTA